MRIGAHESVMGGLYRAFERAAADGAGAIQIFSKNAAQWREPPLLPDAVAAFRAARQAWSASGRVLAHASYLVNLCADDDLLLSRSKSSLVAELRRSEALGVDCVVFHPGARLALDEEVALDRIGESIAEILERTDGLGVRLCIENTAGQGTTVGDRLDAIGAMIERAGARRDRLGVCIDTQHAFAARHDLRSAEGYEAFWTELDRRIGLDRVACLHLNDSRCALGQRLDRHEAIGEGQMGLLPFWRLANDPRFAATPAVVELPPAEGAVTRSLAALRALEGAPEPAAAPAFALTPPEPRAPRRRRA